jgi:SAM-dependent methyltransferase
MTRAKRAQEVVHRKFRAAMLRRLRRVSGRERFARAIDLGCGPGDWTAEYAGLADAVVGVDVNRSFLGVAARHARAAGVERRIVFHEQSIDEFDGFESADLVCLGACLMYVDDDAVAQLFARIARGAGAGAWVYVRATVTNPLRRGYATDGGFYREAAFYERIFAASGFAVADRMFSAPLLAYESVAALLQLDHAKLPARALGSLFAGGHWLRRLAAGRNNFLNWVLRRA